MGIEIPGSLRTVASVAVGQDWPEADETSLRRLSDAWELAAVRLDRAGADGARSIQPALDALTGDVNDAVAGRWREVGASVEELAAACRQLADSCESTAADVEHAKLSIIAALGLLAVEIASLLAAAAGTFGASAAAIPAAEIATQVTVRMILQELIGKLGREIAVAVLRDGGLSAGIQLMQMAEGNRDRFDMAALGKDVYGTVVSTAVSSPLGSSQVNDLLVDGIANVAERKLVSAGQDMAAGMIGAHAGEDAKAALGQQPPAEPPSAASSLNMN
ncbi:hypothetical protein AB4Z09_02995 [Rhodococcus sp. TAF43]|uniref:WXG100-like domain-containing protein n=1 Tax=unclassified Rhodococcus (in: high G+C Gram-positive bacteria) TaxID=192944 RepID=UPI000E0C4ABD|nr:MULTISPECIES: hypothetical protein [unclassified Rhodococcus (in: high G+C Gram-positive bacteria)]QKT12966.1 hypothetical protein HUN07_21625 [Rhodococcus sp. W8901]RDI33753.1 hypothetical protein DEU38_102108 [Rhodococcus sp. AG1013]